MSPRAATTGPRVERALQVIRRHLGAPGPGPRLPSVSEIARRRRDPFRILVATMISTRTRDEVTELSAERLLARAPDARRLAAMSASRIARLIYPAGFYLTKAGNLRRAARLLLQRHKGRVPSSLEDLLELPGVGRKVANLVRGLGFGLPAICVDTHVHRIANRLGWVSTRSPVQTERALTPILSRRWWTPMNELLVRFGQTVCTPLSPRCSACPLGAVCPRRGVARSR